MLLPFLPRFVMPALELPDLSSLPAPGTRLSIPAAQELYENLMQYGVRLLALRTLFREEWEAHYTQHGYPVPPLDLPPPRKA